MKRYDSFTIEKIGIPGAVLMERAALETFRALEAEGLVAFGRSAVLLTGTGNNGADGLALARMFSEAGMDVEAWIVGREEKATELWKLQRKILDSYPVKIVKEPGRSAYDIVVDALFGIGLKRAVEGEYAEAVNCVNERLGGFKIAMDIPSGLSADDGTVLGTAFRADMTVTYGFEKRGLYLYPGADFAGKVLRVPIGITSASFGSVPPEMFYLDESLEELFPKRNPAGNKGSFGKVLVIAGRQKLAGAAVLCAGAAFSGGAGMVKVISDASNREVIQLALPEAMFGTEEDLEESLEWCTCICFGPGAGTGAQAYHALERVTECGKPAVIDADGISLLAEHPKLRQALKEDAGGSRFVLTPHAGELRRLYQGIFGVENTPSMEKLKVELWTYAGRIAKELRVTVAAKDARTAVCKTGEKICLNIAGNSGMATAGSGDVLAGMITALLAQGIGSYEAACRGVRIHALSGDRAAEKFGEHALRAGDLIAGLREAGKKEPKE